MSRELRSCFPKRILTQPWFEKRIALKKPLLKQGSIAGFYARAFRYLQAHTFSVRRRRISLSVVWI